jgi:hypothetical protein
MTVLPDAPTDPATGLEIPTIAVATDGGVSVIKDDGTVVDSADTGENVAVGFSADGVLHYTRGGNYNSIAEEFNVDGFGSRFDADFYSYLPDNVAYKSLVLGSKDRFRGGLEGVEAAQVDYSDYSKSLGFFTTSSYTTGWMPGDIKLAALADTTAETLSGSNLITNSEFTTDITGWTDGNTEGTITWNASQYMDLARNSGSGGNIALQDISTVAGKTFVITFDIVAISHGLTARLGTTNSPAYSTTGTKTFTAVATSTTETLGFNLTNSATATASIDNVSVRLADPDRSVNGNGLAVHGSITKAPVATGADVVGYSGWSASNYLEQPYNDDLDFGTGDFSVMGWIKTSEVGTDYIVQRSSANTSAGDGFFAWVTGSGVLGFATRNQGASSSITGGTDVTNGSWQHFAAVCTNSGEELAIYVNGEIDVTGTVTARSVTGADQKIYIGTRADNANFFAGSLALLRISAAAPTADQIAKIYEDEKVLFQEDAKATLTGTSDAVTALAHDPDTDLLHVGTSGGRSVFQGLRRVEEHTGTNSQSLAAISAVDGLVVEGK